MKRIERPVRKSGSKEIVEEVSALPCSMCESVL